VVAMQSVVSLATGQSLAGMWTMVNSLQILRFLLMMKIFLSQSIFAFITGKHIISDKVNLNIHYRVVVCGTTK